MELSDPHAASSFNHMHNNAHGTGGNHILPKIQYHISDLPGKMQDEINSQYVDPYLFKIVLFLK